MPLHHGRRRAIPQGRELEGLIFQSITDEAFTFATKRYLNTFALGEITTEFSLLWNVTLTGVDTHGASVITISNGDSFRTCGVNHGSGFNQYKCNIAYYDPSSGGYEVWQGVNGLGYIANDYSGDKMVAEGVPYKFLLRCKVGLPWQLFYDGVLIHTYTALHNQDLSALTMGVFVGGFHPTNNNTDCVGTLHKSAVFNRYIPDSEIEDAFALIA